MSLQTPKIGIQHTAFDNPYTPPWKKPKKTKTVWIPFCRLYKTPKRKTLKSPNQGFLKTKPFASLRMPIQSRNTTLKNKALKSPSQGFLKKSLWMPIQGLHSSLSHESYYSAYTQIFFSFVAHFIVFWKPFLFRLFDWLFQTISYKALQCPIQGLLQKISHNPYFSMFEKYLYQDQYKDFLQTSLLSHSSRSFFYDRNSAYGISANLNITTDSLYKPYWPNP